MNIIAIRDLANGIYKDGFGNIKKLPLNEIDRSLIAKAVKKRIRKAQRNIAINANAWVGDEHGVPLPRMSL